LKGDQGGCSSVELRVGNETRATGICIERGIVLAQRKSLLLRLPPQLVDELNRWAKDDLRSLNAQVEYLLREAVRTRRKNLNDDELDQTE
jgi:hypothetical protein